MARNELAKWQKLNSKNLDKQFISLENSTANSEMNSLDIDGIFSQDVFPDKEEQKISNSVEDHENIEVIHLPPMSRAVRDCTRCFSKEMCSLAAVSLESHIER